MSETEKVLKDPLDMPRKEGFLIPLGVFAQAILYTLVGTYAMYYFTDIVGINPLTVGTLFLLARIWDAVNDVLFGVITDKTKTKWGKFKPYLMFAPIFASFTCVLMFAVPEISMTGRLIYAAVFYILFDMAYTVLDIPLWAAPAIMTPKDQKVTSLISRNQLFSSVGALVAMVVTMILVVALGGEKGGGFANTAIIYGVIAFVLTTIAGIAMKERVAPKQDKEKMKIKEILKVALKNKYLIIGMLASTLIATANGVKGLVATYFAANNLGDIGLLPILFLAVSIPGFIGIACVPLFVKKFGKKKTCVWSTSIAILISVATYFIGYTNFYPALAAHAVFSFFTYIPVVIFISIFADAVIYGEWKHGVRAEGTIFAFRTLNGKIANALGPFILGLMLVGIGYVADQQQTQKALDGLQFTITIIPAIILALCIVPMFFYHLNKEKIDEMQQEIKMRNGIEPESQSG